MRDFDFIVAGGGGTFRLNAEGRYFRYMSGSAGGASPAIVVRGLDSGAALRVLPGQSFTLPASERGWLLTNPGAASIAGFVLVGDGNFGDQTVAGVVEVVDGSRSRVLAGSSFTAAYSITGAAGQRAKAGLWNPVGTGRRAIVKRIYAASSPATDTLSLSILTAPLGTVDLVTLNKLAGGAASTSIRRTFDSSAGSTGTGVALLNVAGNKTEPFNFDDPWILPPGFGLIVQSITDTATITVTMEFVDEANA